MPSLSHHDACAAPSRKPPVARHILHIVADDLGYRDIGYNNAAFSSPHLDEPAKALEAVDAQREVGARRE